TRAYDQAVAAGATRCGAPPRDADRVAVARARLDREHAKAQARYAEFLARPRRPGRIVPPDEHHKVRAARAAYQAARTRADADDNLTADGPDRLIADAKRHVIDRRAATDPATGDPPEDATAREKMNHRLRTDEGLTLYKRRAPMIETPNAWLKDRRGLRRFAR